MRVLLKDFYSTAIRDMEVTSDELSEQVKVPSDKLQARGVVSDLGGHCVGLFVSESKLHLILDDAFFNIQSDAVSVSFNRDGDVRSLKVTVGERVICFVYSQAQLPVSTPYYTEDEEDADFGLWLANVLASNERCSIFVQSWSKLLR